MAMAQQQQEGGGLLSIAMAVAHLERIQSEESLVDQQEESKPSLKFSTGDHERNFKEPADEKAPSPPPPLPSSSVRPMRFGSSARVVTMDEGSTPSQAKVAAVAEKTLAPIGILAEGAKSFAVASSVPSADTTTAANAPPAPQQPADLTYSTYDLNEGELPLPSLESILNADVSASAFPPAPAPTEVIHQVLPYDVLCGRGGETNHHTGNKRYRELVKACQPAYLVAKRREKPRIAKGIVLAVRKVGGRFLKKDSGNTWKDVGNTRAREKTSQALREGAPEMRSHMTAMGDLPPAEEAEGAGTAAVEPLVNSNTSEQRHHLQSHGNGAVATLQYGNAMGSPPMGKRPFPMGMPSPTTSYHFSADPQLHMQQQQHAMGGGHAMMVSSASSPLGYNNNNMEHPHVKRRRVSDHGVAGVSAVSAAAAATVAAPYASGSWMMSAPSADTATAAAPAAPAPAAASNRANLLASRVAATVSGDDEEDGDSDSTSSEKDKQQQGQDKRGPRIKLLKKRLMENQ